MKASPKQTHDTKWVFIKKGTCSRTFFYILNREFDQCMEEEEMAADPLAGGIAQHGYQCGQLWGAVLAVGAESFRRSNNAESAMGLAIEASKYVLRSFVERAGSPDCENIIRADLMGTGGALKLLVTGKFLKCFRLADKWAPEAIASAQEGLMSMPDAIPGRLCCCASEVIKRMGGTEQEMALVAGFSGGLAMSGNACGALAAAIWKKTHLWQKENPDKNSMGNPRTAETIAAFLESTDYEFVCEKITGKLFTTTREHSEFVANGGCEKLLGILATS